MLYKKEIIVIAISLFGWVIFVDAQTEKSDSSSIETVSFNLLSFGYPQLTYEKIINKHSFGLSIGSSFGRQISGGSDSTSEIEYLILPYYRFNFGKNIFRKFFLEANAIYYNENVTLTGTRNPFKKESHHTYGFGGAIGMKLIRVDGWLVDLLFGPIPLINAASSGFFNSTYPRIGVTFGKRF